MSSELIVKNLEIIDKLFKKTTESSELDLLSVDIIRTLLIKDSELTDKLIEIFKENIKLENLDNVNISRVIEILEECMVVKKGKLFRDKILEEDILRVIYDIIEKKYDQETIKNELKNKFMDNILLWTIIYPKRFEFKKLYDSINNERTKKNCHEKNNGKTEFEKHNFRYIKTNDRIDISFNKNNSIDLKSANLIIQYYINQNKRGERLLEAQRTQLNNIKQDIKDLNEMLENNDRSLNIEKSMKKLYENCKNFNLIVERLPIFTNEESEEETDEKEEIVLLRDEALQVNDDLCEVIKNYDKLNISDNFEEITEEHDKGHEMVNKEQSDILLLEIESTNEKEKNAQEQANNSLVNKFTFDNLIVLPVPPLNPTPLYNEHDNKNQIEDNENSSQKKNEPEIEDDFFLFVGKKADEYFKEHLKDDQRIGKFEKIKPKKVSLSEMISTNKEDEKLVMIENTQSKTCNKKLIICDSSSSDEEILIDGASYTKRKLNTKHETKLIEILLDPNSIELDWKIPRIKIKTDTDGIKVFFQFAKNRPGIDVFVIMISVINYGQIAIGDFHLEAAVNKPCKLRLLKPNKTLLPGILPLQNPVDNMKQILLLYNPTKKPVNIICILSYKHINDDDKINESIIAHIPYVE